MLVKPGYPLGPHALAATLGTGLRVSVAAGVHGGDARGADRSTALAAYGGLERVRPGWRWLGALLAGFAYSGRLLLRAGGLQGDDRGAAPARLRARAARVRRRAALAAGAPGGAARGARGGEHATSTATTASPGRLAALLAAGASRRCRPARRSRSAGWCCCATRPCRSRVGVGALCAVLVAPGHRPDGRLQPARTTRTSRRTASATWRTRSARRRRSASGSRPTSASTRIHARSRCLHRARLASRSCGRWRAGGARTTWRASGRDRGLPALPLGHSRQEPLQRRQGAADHGAARDAPDRQRAAPAAAAAAGHRAPGPRAPATPLALIVLLPAAAIRASSPCAMHRWAPRRTTASWRHPPAASPASRTLFLVNDDFGIWLLRGAVVARPAFLYSPWILRSTRRSRSMAASRSTSTRPTRPRSTACATW